MTGLDTQSISEATARILLDTKAVHFNATTPFRLTSGRASPVYIDCRKLISFTQERQALMKMAQSLILENIKDASGKLAIDSVAGGETAGIPFAAWLADGLMLPMQYVRKKPKGFGRNAQIEGQLEPGTRVLLVEDLTTDSRSKLNFCAALREAGAIVEHVFVVFHYDIFKESRTLLAEQGIALHALATWWDVLKLAKQEQYFDTQTLTEVERFLHEPAKWSMEHGGVSELANA